MQRPWVRRYSRSASVRGSQGLLTVEVEGVEVWDFEGAGVLWRELVVPVDLGSGGLDEDVGLGWEVDFFSSLERWKIRWSMEMTWLTNLVNSSSWPTVARASLDGGLEALVEKETKGFIVKVEVGCEGLEFDGIRSCGSGLFQGGEFIAGSCSKVLVQGRG